MYAVMAKPVTTQQAKKDSLPEAWIYRADFLSSKVFHIRFGVLNGNTVELYKGDHMVLENAFPLADAKISSVRAVECDVKPQGVNMLKGYFDGSIESKCLVRHAACPFMTLPSSSQSCQTCCYRAAHLETQGTQDSKHPSQQTYPWIRHARECSLLA